MLTIPNVLKWPKPSSVLKACQLSLTSGELLSDISKSFNQLILAIKVYVCEAHVCTYQAAESINSANIEKLCVTPSPKDSEMYRKPKETSSSLQKLGQPVREGWQKKDCRPYLDVVVPVVVKVEDPVQLAVYGDSQVVGVLDALAEGLPGVLLHLDVVKLPGSKREKLNLHVGQAKATFSGQ